MSNDVDIGSRARKVRLLVMDCDGVLTDGRLYFGPRGEEIKVFHVRDGFGLSEWHKAGFRSAILSGRRSQIVELRARELGVEFVVQGRDDKESALLEIIGQANVELDEVAYIGDDKLDVPAMRMVGLAVTVADGHPSAQEAAHLATSRKGGHAAIRELCDLLLSAKQDS